MTSEKQELLVERDADSQNYNHRLEFEHELIHRRITWLLTSQSILFAAYGVAMNTGISSSEFFTVTPLVGTIISVLVLIGILAGICAKITAWRDHQKQYPEEKLGVRNWITYMGLIPDALLPLLFAGAWLWIYCFD